MQFNNQHKKPLDENEILIAFSFERSIEMISGWYDINDCEFYDFNGENIEIDYIVGWIEKPELELN